MKKMSRSKSAIVSIVFIFIVMYFSTQPVMAGIVNGNFSQDPPGLGWNYSNADVFSDITSWNGNGYAILQPYMEEEASVSELYQENIFLPPNATQLLFDIEMVIGEEIHETDVFTASFGTRQYTLASSDLSGFDYSETVIFDLTGFATGPFTLSFQLVNEPDGVLTTVAIDNIQFVPAPGAFILAIIGLFSAAASRKLKA